jgi:hypothetical protein
MGLEVLPMAVSRWILVAALLAVVGCSDSKQGGGQTPKEDWRDKKKLAEMRPKVEGIKENLRTLQTKLNAQDPKKFASREVGENEWRPHEDYLSDPTYKALHTQLTTLVAAHNSLLDQNPTWKTERLDLKLE